MAIPDYQSIMLPLLKLAGHGETLRSRDAVESLGEHFSLTELERRQLLPSGKQATFDNRVGWARTYLSKAGLLESPKRGFFAITAAGQNVLSESPPEINVKFLERFPEFKAFRELRRTKSKASEASAVESTEVSPEEQLENAYQELRAELGADILKSIKDCSPQFFEQLVIDIIVKMGYGGSRKEAGQAVGRSGDEGIDGIIKEDRLGLDIIYLQAKRWEAVVGRPEIQKFAGALQGQRARKGIFITTSSFTKEALRYVQQIESKIILIEGEHLVELMIDHGVGVSTEATYEVKQIDSDYFTD